MPQGQPGQPSQPPNYMNLGLKKVATTKSVVIFDIVSHDYILQGAIINSVKVSNISENY